MNQNDNQNLVGIILLAAGASKRMGQPKQLLQINQQSLIRRSAETALQIPQTTTLVVLGANAEKIKPEIEELPLHITYNTNWEEGMGSSIRKGVQKILDLKPNLKALIIMVCDQPHLQVGQLQKLIRLYEKNKTCLVASEYAGVLGVPALFDQNLFSDLLSLEGQIGARKMILKYQNQLDKVSFPEGKIDLDTPSDYQSFLNDYKSKEVLDNK